MGNYSVLITNTQGAGKISPKFNSQSACKRWLKNTYSDLHNLRAEIRDHDALKAIIAIKPFGYLGWVMPENEYGNY